MTELLLKYICDHPNDLRSDSYGPRYRCSVTLKDGTSLPCVILRFRQPITDLALTRLEQERSGRSKLVHEDNPYRHMVEHFVTNGNRIDSYAVRSVSPSRYAIPGTLLEQIQGETTMGWTGWVFEMKDGARFNYGTAFHFAFLDLPDGYTFEDVARVHNHAFLDASGKLQEWHNDSIDDEYFTAATTYRDRVFFECFIGED